MRRPALLLLIPLAAALLAFFAFGRSAERGSPSPAPRSAALEDSTLEKATFAGGCFWCVESAFQDLAGVEAAVSGFSGGTTPDPTYDEVSSGQTDHVESVQIAYDPGVISYEELLDVYWRQIDPTDGEGQFADRGAHYRPVIFYHGERQQQLAEQSKRDLAESGPFDEPIAVTIEPYTGFYAVEEYHQDYYKKNPERYKQYYEGSGRGPFLRRIWGDEKQSTSASAHDSSSEGKQAAWRSFEKPSQATPKAQLTPMQYRVT